MKHSAFLAAAVVIGGSFLIPVPAEARNGWVLIGEGDSGLKHEKLESYAQNRYANVRVASNGGSYPKTIDCVRWLYTFNNDGTGWSPVLPGTLGEASANFWCR